MGARSYASDLREGVGRGRAVVNLDGLIYALFWQLNTHLPEETRVVAEKAVLNYGIPIAK